MKQFILFLVFYLHVQVYARRIEVSSEEKLDEDDKKILDCLKPFIEKAIDVAKDNSLIEQFGNSPLSDIFNIFNTNKLPRRTQKRTETIILDIDDKDLNNCLIDPILKKNLLSSPQLFVDDVVRDTPNTTDDEETNIIPKVVPFQNSNTKWQSTKWFKTSNNDNPRLPNPFQFRKNDFDEPRLLNPFQFGKNNFNDPRPLDPFQIEKNNFDFNMPLKPLDTQNLLDLVFPDLIQPMIPPQMFPNPINQLGLVDDIMRDIDAAPLMNSMFNDLLDGISKLTDDVSNMNLDSSNTRMIPSFGPTFRITERQMMPIDDEINSRRNLPLSSMFPFLSNMNPIVNHKNDLKPPSNIPFDNFVFVKKDD